MPHPEIGPKAEMPRTVALLLSRACPNQVAPGNETEPQNGDRVKQKKILYPCACGRRHQNRSSASPRLH